MIIIKKRINSAACFSNAKIDSNISVRVENISRFPLEMKKFGFPEDASDGTVILPAAYNKYSLRNAERYTTIDRSLPKEKYTQTLYWTRTEWAGRGETREVTGYVDIVRERFHRDFHEPFSVSFTLVDKDSQQCIVADPIKYSESNILKLKNTVNMLLSLFGECTVDFNNEMQATKKIRLDWEILPKGQYPWSQIRSSIEEICKKCRNTQKQMMLRNCEAITGYAPDFVAYGRSGFRGYVIFGFKSRNLYILESIYPNNATYIFENDWENLSKMTKAEILNQNLHKARIIHNSHWLSNFNKVMEGKYE